MGIFDFLKKSTQSQPNASMNILGKPGKKATSWADSSTIAPDERKYYQPDEYYTLITHPGTTFERRVISFEERKNVSFPTTNGLYVGEVLLLEYCSYGKYPKPASGYPGFWWFEYGIRDVGHMLESLEKRGYLEWCSAEQGLAALKVDELKQILEHNGLSVSGKKAALIERIVTGVPNIVEILPDSCKKYKLTSLGEAELTNNSYIPYMHKHPHKTTEDNTFSPEFNVWSINKLLEGNAQNWRRVVGKIEEKRFGVNTAEADPAEALLPRISSAEMRAYLASQKNYISKQVRTSGDGFMEESKGLDYKRIGKDKEALVHFYIAIGKRFDAPALYSESVDLLEKYELYSEALYVIEQGLRNVPENNRHRENLVKQRDRLMKKAK